MKFIEGGSFLSKIQWDKASACMKPYESPLIPIAKNLNMRVRLGVKWPSIELYESEFSYLNSFKLILNSDYLENNELFFELIYQKYSRKLFFKKKLIQFEKLAKYSMEQIKDLDTVLKDIKNKITDQIQIKGQAA